MSGAQVPYIPGTAPNERTMKDRIDHTLAKGQAYFGEPSGVTPDGFYNLSSEDLDGYAQQTFMQAPVNNWQTQMINTMSETNKYLRALQQQPVQQGYMPQVQQQQFLNTNPMMGSQTNSQLYNGNLMQPQVMQQSQPSARFVQQQPSPAGVNMNQQTQQQQTPMVSQTVEDPSSGRIAKLENMMGQLLTHLQGQSNNSNNGNQSGF